MIKFGFDKNASNTKCIDCKKKERNIGIIVFKGAEKEKEALFSQRD